MPLDFSVKPEDPKPEEKTDKPETTAKLAERKPKEDKKAAAPSESL